MRKFLICFFTLIITGIILFIIFIPKRELVYTKKEITLLNNGIETNLKILSPIMVEVNKNKEEWKVYSYVDHGQMLGLINKKEILYKDSNEYVELKKVRDEEIRKQLEIELKEKAKRDKIAKEKQRIEEEKQRKIEQKKLEEAQRKRLRELEEEERAFRELENNILKGFTNVDLHDYAEGSTDELSLLTGNYSFYLRPEHYYRLSYQERKNLLYRCIDYAEWKKGVSRKKAEISTSIKSSYDGSVLAKITHIR